MQGAEASIAAVEMRGVSLSFGARRLTFDCTVAPGARVAITGASGSGKTTLINLIAGFEKPDTGSIWIEGRDVAGLDPAERPVSIIFQEHNLFTHLDVATNIGLGIDPGLRLDAAAKARITEALARVGLEGFATRKPASLSGGERQRVALARAFVRRRPIMLLDEPFAALDPGLRQEMGDLLLDLQRETGSTLLMITHHPDDVKRLADNVMFLDDGRILLHEQADVFLTEVAHPAVRRFLGNNSSR